jgi:hypothetical protein
MRTKCAHITTLPRRTQLRSRLLFAHQLDAPISDLPQTGDAISSDRVVIFHKVQHCEEALPCIPATSHARGKPEKESMTDDAILERLHRAINNSVAQRISLQLENQALHKELRQLRQELAEVRAGLWPPPAVLSARQRAG